MALGGEAVPHERGTPVGLTEQDSGLRAWGVGRVAHGWGLASAATSTRNRRRANMARIRQSRPDSGLGFQIGP